MWITCDKNAKRVCNWVSSIRFFWSIPPLIYIVIEKNNFKYKIILVKSISVVIKFSVNHFLSNFPRNLETIALCRVCLIFILFPSHLDTSNGFARAKRVFNSGIIIVLKTHLKAIKVGLNFHTNAQACCRGLGVYFLTAIFDCMHIHTFGVYNKCDNQNTIYHWILTY